MTTESNDYILQLEGISKYFGTVISLQDVTLRLRRGEVHCLLGDNGAGKSTLIKTLAGVHRPNKGRYLIEGKEVHFLLSDAGSPTIIEDTEDASTLYVLMPMRV